MDLPSMLTKAWWVQVMAHKQLQARIGKWVERGKLSAAGGDTPRPGSVEAGLGSDPAGDEQTLHRMSPLSSRGLIPIMSSAPATGPSSPSQVAMHGS